MSRKTTFRILVCIGFFATACICLYPWTIQREWNGVVMSPSDIPWGGEIVAKLSPEPGIAAESYYYVERDQYFAHAFGRCSPESFGQFVRRFNLETTRSDVWNDWMVGWVPSEVRKGFVFAEHDIAFLGSASVGDVKAIVRGAYSEDAGVFAVEIVSQ
ncbi:MAG: hypothetical protein KDA60_02150 [Planctomycetales bacterium]|nr:hypothetical protein [Planctomycetales bacterium]